METWILHESNEKANSLRKRIRELGLDCPPERLVELEPGSETTVDPFAGERLVFLVLNQIQPEHFAVLYALKQAVIPTASVSDSNLLSCNLAATDLC